MRCSCCSRSGLSLPVYPVKGYALTVPIGTADSAPRSSVMDEHSKIMVTRLGNRLRAAGIAEVGGYDRPSSRAKCATAVLKNRVTDCSRLAADYATAPIIGRGCAR